MADKKNPASQMSLSENESGSEKKRKGPPNRMNDLVYRDWMKFQKSFFRYSGDQELVDQSVEFFTKSKWDDGSRSRTLLLGFDSVISVSNPGDRVVTFEKFSDIEDLIENIRKHVAQEEPLDFLMVDLRGHLADAGSVNRFVALHSNALFGAIRDATVADRYLAVLVPTAESDGSGFPIPWAVSLAGRDHLRLRDERVGIDEADGSVFYCVIFQNAEDAFPAETLTEGGLSVASPEIHIPSWTIPKPPARKKNEKLHPAKYPETLVEQFISVFSEEGDIVFDPMVGTGSTTVAAIRSGRRGVGIDLVDEFVEIAKERCEAEAAPTLFSTSIDLPIIVQGDSTELDSIASLNDLTFDYAVTSPPYWSMLTNPGSENQRKRRDEGLKTVYSDDDRDLGNVTDYSDFLDLLETVYVQVAAKLRPGGFLTVVVKNVKRNHVVYPLAWDLTRRLCRADAPFEYSGTTLWCQDDVGLKPFAVGIHWVSNTLHQYCLHYRKRG